VITDEELAAALAGRDHWRAVEEDAAVYEPPGVPAYVRVGRIRRAPREGPGRHNRYYATLIRDGRALHTVPAGFAEDAVAWAERVKLS
jgi:hypothetical protein